MKWKTEMFVFLVIAAGCGVLAWLVTGDPVAPIWGLSGMLLAELTIRLVEKIKRRRQR